MISVHSVFEPADDLLKEFDSKDGKFKNRFSCLLGAMQEYIKRSDYIGKVVVNELVLGYALTDYFEDIKRLKDFHHVPHINSIKLISYTVYWLLRRKPMQVLINDKDIKDVNERFALAYVLEFLNDESKGNIILRENKGLQAFRETLFYYFSFRHYTPQDIEMIIMAFFAGQIYQSSETDISGFLPVSDHIGEKSFYDDN